MEEENLSIDRKPRYGDYDYRPPSGNTISNRMDMNEEQTKKIIHSILQENIIKPKGKDNPLLIPILNESIAPASEKLESLQKEYYLEKIWTDEQKALRIKEPKKKKLQ